MKMWGSRFEKPPDDLFAQYNDSFGFDWRLYEADIRGSRAYSEALARAEIISEDESAEIRRGLEKVQEEFERGLFEVKPSDEDIHTAVERRLFELIGEPALKLHTGRSRNDQVATDTRLFVRDAITRVDQLTRQLQSTIVKQAEAQFGVLMPGYTHLRRAQPVLTSHYLLSFFWMLQRDRERFAQTKERANVLPLGAGALAGSAFAIDRQRLAQELGFERPSENSMDAVSDRDFIAEFLFDAALVQVHLSRFAEDLILFSSAEFGFVRLDDAYATGSSLMPQKKNPDALELARGKTGRLIGYLTAMLVTLKGLPSTYDKDLQEDKEPLFDAVDTLEMTLPVLAGVVSTLEFNREKMRSALDDGMLATDLADYLVRRGETFREAHRAVGDLVKRAEARGVSLTALKPADFQEVCDRFGPDAVQILDFERSIQQREIAGGTGLNAVRDQIEAAKALFE
jgi:argininosuccinate lyase